jgi:hypothetical protein
LKIELLKSVFLGSLVLGALAAGSLNANADGANKNTLHHNKVMSSTEFYDLVKHTKPDQVAVNFGKPDEMLTLKNASGEAEGVVWVYHKAVLDEKNIHDARFVLINGVMKYVTLSSAA